MKIRRQDYAVPKVKLGIGFCEDICYNITNREGV